MMVPPVARLRRRARREPAVARRDRARAGGVGGRSAPQAGRRRNDPRYLRLI